jgi:hypothetical protein
VCNDKNFFAVLHAFEIWHISEEFISNLYLTTCLFLLLIHTEVIFGCVSKNKKHVNALQDFCVLFHVFKFHSQLIHITYTQRMWTNISHYYKELSAQYHLLLTVQTLELSACYHIYIYKSTDTKSNCTISLTFNSTETKN